MIKFTDTKTGRDITAEVSEQHYNHVMHNIHQTLKSEDMSQAIERAQGFIHSESYPSLFLTYESAVVAIVPTLEKFYPDPGAHCKDPVYEWANEQFTKILKNLREIRAV